MAITVAVGCVAISACCGGRWRGVAVALACVVAVAGSCGWRLATLEASPLHRWAERRTTVVVDALVTSDPRRFHRFGSDSAMVRLDVRRATSAEVTASGHIPVLAVVRDRADDLSVGRRVRMHGRLRPSTDVDVVATLDTDRRSRGRPGAWWWLAADRVRDGVRHAVRRAPPDARALVPALVDGDDSRVSDRVQAEFRRSGLTHLLAVSGTNLTIVLVLALTVARFAGVHRRRLMGVGAVAVVGFVLLARPDPSVLRAAAMGSVGLVAVAVGGRGGLRALSTAVVALLFIDPWLARSAGFVLSVCATAGILLAANPLAARFGRWMPRWCAMAIAVPLAAQLACLPAVAAISGQVSVVGIAANVLAAPLVAPATVAGLVGGLTDLVHGGAAVVPGAVAGWCASGLVWIAHVSSGLTGAAVPWHLPWWVLIPAMPLLLFGLWRFADRPAVVVGIALGVSIGMVQPPQVGWPPAHWLMVACDVGQGDATAVNVGGGSAILVDSGPDPMLVDGCLRRLHVRRLPLVVTTHAHADHLAGWSGAVRHRDVGTVVHGPSGGPGRATVEGDGFRIGSVRVDVLWPPVGAPVPDPDDGTAMNNSSIVLRVQLQGERLLLSGDVEPEAQSALVASGEQLAADVLKFSHHGSGRQLPAFLQAVGARVATISVGKDNDYGHPAASALRMIQQAGMDSRRTDLDGDIAITADDGRLRVVTRR